MKKFLRVFFAVILVIAVGFGVYQIGELSKRIERIESKLGGPKKIACNEKDTVEKVRRSVVRVVGGDGEGSGFAIQQGGFILTNFHVIDGESDPKVILPDNTFETAQIMAADKDADLAVLKIKKDLPVVTFARMGWVCPAEELLAIGYPLGGSLDGESFVIRGAFSRCATDKEKGIRYLLTDMTMVSGISGGPMVNICGDVVGINTSGLVLGGMGMAVSSDSIMERCRRLLAVQEPRKDVKTTVYEPDKNALEAVRAFYNYLKARRLEKAFELLSENFVMGYSFEHWAKGYQPLLDTSIVFIRPDKKAADRINVKLATKDLVNEEIVYKYFEGYWDVRRINGKLLLWDPEIKEVKEPEKEWFADVELIKEIEEFVKTHKEAEEYKYDMYQIAQEPGNEQLSLQELYKKAKEKDAAEEKTQ